MLRIFTPSVLPLLMILVTSSAVAQSPTASDPIVGLRDQRPTGYALVGADVVPQPGSVIENATILIEDGSILGVSTDLSIPAGFQVIDCQGKRIYPGLIDAFSELNVPLTDEQPGYWNSNITPQRNVSVAAGKDPIDQAAKLRSQGITARLVAPEGGIIKGTSCVVQLGSEQGQRLLTAKAWQHLQLTVPRTGSRPRYPNSPMGATALLRQSLYDAQWYRRAWTAYRAQPTLPRPEKDRALEVLVDAIDDGTFVIDAQNERMAIRAGKVADEFSLILSRQLEQTSAA